MSDMIVYVFHLESLGAAKFWLFMMAMLTLDIWRQVRRES